MPYIEVKIARKSISDQKAQEISLGITEIMTSVLRKKRSLVAVSIETIDPTKWFVAETVVAEQNSATAFVSARITQDTNTEEEKEEAIKAIFQLLSDVLGIMAEASYIVLESLPSTDWGYSGKTQGSRKSAKQNAGEKTIDYDHYLRKSHQLRSDYLFLFVSKLLNKLRQFTHPSHN